MYVYRHIITLISTLVLSLQAMAQHYSALEFETTKIDFGTIQEEGGCQSRRFEAKNVGSTPVAVKEIVSTCDCTVVEYSTETIAPQGSFNFDVVYDPANRPGRFERKIFVVTSDSDTPIELEIRGRVTPRERSVEEIYPYDMGGGLRLESTFATFSYVEHGYEQLASIAYVNNSTETITLRLKPQLESGALKVEYPRSIEPGATGDITFCYSVPMRSRYYGSLDDRFVVEVNGVKSRFLLTSYAVAIDNFDDVDDIFSPRAVYSKKNIKFGDVNSASGSLDAYFTLQNGGKAPLIIRKVECDSKGVRCALRRGSTIADGESREVRLRLNPRRVESTSGSVTVRVHIITNDPVTPLQVIRVTAMIHNEE